MATKVKGITIELSADTTGLESALKNVNKELSSTQKQLSSVNKSLQLDPGNLQLIEQKQRLLAKASDETKQKLEALKKAQEEVGKGLGTNDKAQEQFDALSREISDTEQKLKSLNTEQKNFAKEAANAETKASSFGQALESFSNKAQAVANATRGLSMAAAGALTGLAAIGVEGAQQADEWAQLSQQIGLSTETIQKFQYASDQIDVDMGTITGAITRMKGNLDGAADAWDRVGVQVKNSKGEYRDIETIFFEAVRGLSEIENETERDTTAMALFGKKANELAGIIDDGGEKMRQLGQEAENMGLIVSDEDIQQLNKFNDTLDGMKAQINAALVQLALPIMQALEPVITAVADAIHVVAEALANVNPTLLKIAGIILIVVAALSPIASLLAKVGMAVMGLQTLLPGVVTAMSALGQAFMTLASNPITWVILAAAMALALLVATIAKVVENWDALASGADTAMTHTSAAIHKSVEAMGNFFDTIKSGSSNTAPTLSAIGEAFSALVGKIQSVVQKVVAAFSNLTNKAQEAGAKVMSKFTSGIESAINGVTNAVSRMANAVKSIWSSLSMDASYAGRDAANRYSSSYNAAVNIKRPSVTSYSVGASADRGRGGGASVTANSVIDAMNNLSAAINRQGGASTNVNVELVGSAKNIFDTVRVQNAKMQTATGYHALA